MLGRGPKVDWTLASCLGYAVTLRETDARSRGGVSGRMVEQLGTWVPRFTTSTYNMLEASSSGVLDDTSASTLLET